MEQLLRQVVLIVVVRQFIRFLVSGRINVFRLSRSILLFVLSLAASVLIGWLMIEQEERLRERTGRAGLPWQSEADDLTLIDGIGETYARALNDVGISNFSQLARQDPVDLSHRMNSRVSPARIRNQDWIGQARKFSQH
jgi:hypothetical protein